MIDCLLIVFSTDMTDRVHWIAQLNSAFIIIWRRCNYQHDGKTFFLSLIDIWWLYMYIQICLFHTKESIMLFVYKIHQIDKLHLGKNPVGIKYYFLYPLGSTCTKIRRMLGEFNGAAGHVNESYQNQMLVTSLFHTKCLYLILSQLWFFITFVVIKGKMEVFI